MPPKWNRMVILTYVTIERCIMDSIAIHISKQFLRYEPKIVLPHPKCYIIVSEVYTSHNTETQFCGLIELWREWGRIQWKTERKSEKRRKKNRWRYGRDSTKHGAFSSYHKYPHTHTYKKTRCNFYLYVIIAITRKVFAIERTHSQLHNIHTEC